LKQSIYNNIQRNKKIKIIDWSNFSNIIDKEKKSIDDIYNNFIKIRKQVYPFTICTNNVDYEKDSEFRDLNPNHDAKGALDKFKPKFDLENKTKEEARKMFIDYGKNIDKQDKLKEKLFNKLYDSDTYDYIDIFLPDLGKKSPIMSLQKNITYAGHVPGVNHIKHNFFKKNKFFNEFEDQLKDLFIIPGNNKNVTFVYEKSILKNYILIKRIYIQNLKNMH